MTQPTLIGATYRNAQGSAIALNNSTWTFVTNTTVDDANATFASDNDGSIPNDSGAEAVMEGRFMYGGYMTTAVDVLLAVGIHDGVSWTAVGSNFYQVEQDSEEQYIRDLEYKVTVPNGHKVGLLAKTASGTTTHYARGYVHFAKSNDGADPALSAACTFIGVGNQSIGLSVSLKNTLPTTTEYGGTVGATTSTGRIFNDSGETLIVDGFWAHFIYINSAFARTLYTDSHLNGVAITDAIDYSGAFSGGNDFAPFFGWYTTEIDDGEYVNATHDFSHATSYGCYCYSFQHSMRSRS